MYIYSRTSGIVFPTGIHLCIHRFTPLPTAPLAFGTVHGALYSLLVIFTPTYSSQHTATPISMDNMDSIDIRLDRLDQNIANLTNGIGLDQLLLWIGHVFGI